MTSTSFASSLETPPAQILHQCVVSRDSKTINKILKGQQSWKAIDHNGETVLHLAFKRKKNILSCQDSIIETLECFVDEGLSVNIKNKVGQTILFSAVEDRLRRVVDFLLEQGANVNACDQNGNSIVHFLIEKQFKTYYDSCIRNGGYSLRHFVEQEDIDFMNWLLSRGVDADIQNNYGKTALNLAMERNLQHVMPILINYMNDVDHIDEKGRTMIESIFKARTKLNARRVPEPSCIYQYCYDSRYDNAIIRLLLEKGVSVDHVNDRGNTVIHKFLKSYDPNAEAIRRMLQRYTKVNAQDRDGNSALHLVIRDSLGSTGQHKKSTVDLVRMLLDKNADVHLKNNARETAVCLAVRVKHFEVLKALLKHGADLSPSANPKAWFLHDISSVPSIEDEKWAPMIDTLVRAGWNVNAVRPGDGFTPLMEACRSNCPAIAQKLIGNSANVNYIEKQSLMRPIHVAALGSRFNQQTSPAVLFQMLAKSGAKINARDRGGQTALHMACDHGYDTVKRLLQLGAHVDARDNEGRLPLHVAVRKRHTGSIKALLLFGANGNDVSLLSMFRVGFEDEIANYLTQYWLKLKAAELPVVDGFADFAKKNWMQQYYVDCLMEVETLKAYNLNSRTTIYDLLYMDVNLKYVFIRKNERLKELVKSPLLQITFPKYYSLILTCYNKAVVRYPLIKSAKRAWYSLTGKDLPDCVERILAYLENEDLRNMAEVEDEINPLKRMLQLSLEEPPKEKKQLKGFVLRL